MASAVATGTILKDFGSPAPAGAQYREPPGRSLEIENGDGLFHVFVCGSRGVGKTGFITRYCQSRFPKWYDPIDVAHHSVENILHHKCLFEFIELPASNASQEDLPSAADAACPGGLGALDALILVYDVGSKTSYSECAEIYQRIINTTGKRCLPVAVVANKFDIFQESREVGEDQGRELADAIGAVFAQCSAKEGDGVRDVVKTVMKRAVDVRVREMEEREREEKCARREREVEKVTRVKRSMSGRILSRLSWGNSGG